MFVCAAGDSGKENMRQDKICAYQTLYECLETVLLLIAPISPFFADAIFQNLNAVTGRLKVAICSSCRFSGTGCEQD